MLAGDHAGSRTVGFDIAIHLANNAVVKKNDAILPFRVLLAEVFGLIEISGGLSVWWCRGSQLVEAVNAL